MGARPVTGETAARARLPAEDCQDARMSSTALERRPAKGRHRARAGGGYVFHCRLWHRTEKRQGPVAGVGVGSPQLYPATPSGETVCSVAGGRRRRWTVRLRGSVGSRGYGAGRWTDRES